jgi:glycosyltransferase involved in cell wall biosynthesis
MRLGLLMSLCSPWAREAATALASAGNEIHVFDFTGFNETGYVRLSDTFQQDEINGFRSSVAAVHLLQAHVSGSGRYVLAARQTRKLLTDLRIDAALALYGGGFTTLLWLSGFRPYVSYVVGSDVLCCSRTRRLLLTKTLGGAAAVYANGEFLANEARTISGRADVRHLYLGVDCSLFKPGSPPASPVRIVCTRGFTSIYNNEVIVRALFCLGDVPEFRFTFVSAGPDLGAVKAIAADLPCHLRDRVRFLGGAPKEQLVAELAGSHIYVSMSRSDGTSVSLLEALACGLFPVLSDIPANREWVEHSQNGLLTSPDDPQALANALRTAIVGTALRERSVGFNRKLVLSRADSRRNMDELATSLSKLVAIH